VVITASVGSVTQSSGTWTWSFGAVDGPADSQTVTVTATDNDGASSSTTFALVVNNVAPVLGPISAPLDPVNISDSVGISASFTDVGVLDTHTAVINWGDGTTSPGTVSGGGGSGTIIGSHTYSPAGVYTVGLTVTDKDGGMDHTTFQYVVIYGPSAGFVTGGGWIQSPAGAYAANPSLTGKTNFGFVSRYHKGGGAHREYRVPLQRGRHEIPEHRL
jgi:hypothetical protein